MPPNLIRPRSKRRSKKPSNRCGASAARIRLRSATRCSRRCGKTSASCAPGRSSSARAALGELAERATRCAVANGRRWNLAWQQALDVRNLVTVASLTARAALHRTESRGSHARSDFPEKNDRRWLVNIHTQRDGSHDRAFETPVKLTRAYPGAGGLPTLHPPGEPAATIDVGG